MSIDIDTLPVVRVDFTAGGHGLQTGMVRIEQLVAQDRTGYLHLNVVVESNTISVIMARSDLYIMGFRSSHGWWCFNDADWPFAVEANDLGHDGQYATLGGLTGNLTIGSISAIGNLSNSGKRSEWKSALRTLLVMVAECARLIPVRMRVLGLLNGIFVVLPLGEVEGYIKNWSKASKGHDMSKEVHPNLRVGFRDPTIIRR